MARFGLLMLNNGNLNENENLKDKKYIKEMLNTSQDLNKSYGYLWLLNVKESLMFTTLQTVFRARFT